MKYNTCLLTLLPNANIWMRFYSSCQIKATLILKKMLVISPYLTNHNKMNIQKNAIYLVYPGLLIPSIFPRSWFVYTLLLGTCSISLYYSVQKQGTLGSAPCVRALKPHFPMRGILNLLNYLSDKWDMVKMHLTPVKYELYIWEMSNGSAKMLQINHFFLQW